MVSTRQCNTVISETKHRLWQMRFYTCQIPARGITFNSNFKGGVIVRYPVGAAGAISSGTTAPPSATPTPGPSPTPTPTPIQGSQTHSVVFSTSADRANPTPLHQAVVAGDIYAFTTPDTGVGGVSFYLDDPSMSGTAWRVEGAAPYDFAGGAVAASNPFSTTGLNDGQHTISALFDMATGPDAAVHAIFTVTNISGTPVPTPTSTPAPTATPAPQPTATPVTQPTATPVPTSGYSLVISSSAQRTGASALDGRTVAGDIFVFVGNDTGIDSVVFFLDDPAAQGTFIQFEANPPYDFAGGPSSQANPFDTSTLPDGQHQITAEITDLDGSISLLSATFTVSNGGGVPASTPTPVATSAPQPTATPVPPATATSTPQPTATAAPVVSAPPPPPSGGGGFAPQPTPTPAPAGPVPPGAPRSVTATADGTDITVEVLPPANDGGSPVTGYRVLTVPSAKLYFIDRLTEGDKITISDLEVGVEYQFQVRAINRAGMGTSGTVSNKIRIDAVQPTPIAPIVVPAPSDAPDADPTATAVPAPVLSPTPVATPERTTVVPTATPAPVPTPTAAPAFAPTAIPTLVPTAVPTPVTEPDPAAVPDVMSINIQPGWNLISFQVLPDDKSVGNVFRSVDGLFVEISTIQNGVAVSYVPGRSDNALTFIEPAHGYWVKMTSAATLVVVGSSVDPQAAIQLDAGWNLIPYLIDEPWPVRLALGSIAGKYDEVRGFETEAKSFFPALPGEFNTLTELMPGEGYLVHMTEAAVLVYP